MLDYKYSLLSVKSHSTFSLPLYRFVFFLSGTPLAEELHYKSSSEFLSAKLFSGISQIDVDDTVTKTTTRARFDIINSRFPTSTHMNRRRVSLSAIFLSYLLIGMNLVSVVYSDGMELRDDLEYSKTTTLSTSSHRKTLRLSSDMKLRDDDMQKEISLSRSSSSSSSTHRKMLRLSPPLVGKVEPDRIGEKCRRTDIVVNQAPTEPMPNGIPGYTVEITNECMSGCKISRIHVSCGWFSSAKLINPRVFKRIHYDDCLVNNGKPLPYGSTISFHYANTFPYPLSVAFVTCS